LRDLETDVRAHPVSCRRGLLVSIEGISGVGKTYLTDRLRAALLDDRSGEFVILESFSKRTGPDLGRSILRALVAAAGGDRFLRGGSPNAETLLLLAIKMHDYESCSQALERGRLVIEGRSIHSTAVYQSLIMHADDHRALDEARAILLLAWQWRPKPDLTVLVTDDIRAAIERAERRDGENCTVEHRVMHERAAELFGRLAADDPAHVMVLDRRVNQAEDCIQLICRWIDDRRRILPCMTAPWRAAIGDAACQERCRLTPA
jgi:dTMP kinase